MRSRSCPHTRACMCVRACVCVCVYPLIVARQRFGKNPRIVVRQRLGKKPPIIARQRLGRTITSVTNTHATIEELLDSSFSMSYLNLFVYLFSALNSFPLFGVILHNFPCAFSGLESVSDKDSFPFKLR
jgi:hypothetical protein